MGKPAHGRSAKIICPGKFILRSYRRDDDGATMVEYAPGRAAALANALRFGLITQDQFVAVYSVRHGRRPEARL